MSWNKRLSSARSALGLNQSQLGEAVGAGQSTVATWERGKNEPDLATFTKLAKVVHRTPEWLAFGVGDELAADMILVPEYDAHAFSGAGGLLEVHEGAGSEAIRHRYAFPKSEFRAIFGTSPDGVTIWEVIGDSMTTTLNPGEKVVVNINDRAPTPPGIFIVWDGLGLVLKRIEYVAHSDPPRVRIMSDNKAYEPYERLVDEAYIQGRVIGSWHRR